MRLFRRKNDGSRSRRERASRRSSEPPSEGLKARVAEAREASGSKLDAGARSKRRKAARFVPAKARVVRVARSVAVDAVGIARELLRWPVRIWMAIAETLGSLILMAWRAVVMPAVRVTRRLLRAALALGERTVTPARGLAVVALAATIALGASQFGDYRAVQVGAPEYNRVESVAQAPEVDRASPRSAHGISIFAIAVGCLFVTVFSVWRNWRLARLLLFLGMAVIAITLLVDRPKGLDLGTTGQAYQGAKAILLGPFWVQLAAGAALIVVGPLLALQLRGERRAHRRRSRVRRAAEEIDSKRAPRFTPGVGA